MARKRTMATTLTLPSRSSRSRGRRRQRNRNKRQRHDAAILLQPQSEHLFGRPSWKAKDTQTGAAS